MTEWFYKATPKKVSFQATEALAINDGFLCRSAHTATSAKVANVKNVKLGDVIHFYFKDGQAARIIGSFEVVGPNRNPHPKRFGKAVKDTALFRVEDAAFAKKLTSRGGDGEGYKVDPVEKKLTGWLLARRDDLKTPNFSTTGLDGRATLVKR